MNNIELISPAIFEALKNHPLVTVSDAPLNPFDLICGVEFTTDPVVYFRRKYHDRFFKSLFNEPMFISEPLKKEDFGPIRFH